MIHYSIDTSIGTKICENNTVYSKFKILHNQIDGKNEIQEQALKLKLVKEKSESLLDLLDLLEMYIQLYKNTKANMAAWLNK